MNLRDSIREEQCDELQTLRRVVQEKEKESEKTLQAILVENAELRLKVRQLNEYIMEMQRSMRTAPSPVSWGERAPDPCQVGGP